MASGCVYCSWPTRCARLEPARNRAANRSANPRLHTHAGREKALQSYPGLSFVQLAKWIFDYEHVRVPRFMDLLRQPPGRTQRESRWPRTTSPSTVTTQKEDDFAERQPPE
jgi:hypothetical protein